MNTSNLPDPGKQCWKAVLCSSRLLLAHEESTTTRDTMVGLRALDCEWLHAWLPGLWTLMGFRV